MKTNLISVAALLLLALGCAASGAAFQPVNDVPQGKALVYIYRSSSLLGGGVRYHVAVGDEKLVYLVRGGYFPYIAEPGETEFWARTEARETITTDLEPGKVYYLKGSVGIGIAVGRPRLEFVDEARGSKELAECNLLPAASETPVP